MQRKNKDALLYLSKISIIIKHEYLTKIKTKGFIIGTIIAPLMVLILILLPSIITYFSLSSTTEITNKIAILDKTETDLAYLIVNSNPALYIQSTKTEQTLKQDILNKKLECALILDSNTIKNGKAKIILSENIGLKVINDIESTVNTFVKDKQLKEKKISKETIELINSPTKIETIKITKEGTKEDNSEIMSILGYLLGFAIYTLMMLYGTQVMQGVIEEKSDRIVEVLTSSVKPFQIMFGKVIGIGAVGLTQVLIWILSIFIVFLILGNIAYVPVDNTSFLITQDTNITSEILSSLSKLNLSIWLVIAFIFYFLSGYFIYATIFATIGATTDQIQDANQLSIPITLLLLIPILMMSNVILEPEGILAVVLSLIPFFTPSLMLIRIALISVPIWQILLSIILLIITFILCLKFGAKIYKLEILKHGTKVNLKSIIQWIKVK